MLGCLLPYSDCAHFRRVPGVLSMCMPLPPIGLQPGNHASTAVGGQQRAAGWMDMHTPQEPLRPVAADVGSTAFRNAASFLRAQITMTPFLGRPLSLSSSHLGLKR